jgi:hypothetical protein
MVELLQRILNIKNLFLKIPRKDSGHSIINGRYLELARISTYAKGRILLRTNMAAEYGCPETSPWWWGGFRHPFGIVSAERAHHAQLSQTTS